MLLALARQVVSCPASPADAEGEGEFTLPGLSWRRAHGGVSAAGSRRWGRSSMFQPNGWEGDGTCPGLQQQLLRVLSEPPSCGGSEPLPAPARNPARALPGQLQVQGKLLPASALEHGPLRDGRTGEHAPSPLKNARFQGQHPLCEAQPKQPGVNHGRAGTGLARWDLAPWPQALKMMKASCTCFSDSRRFPRAHERFTAHAAQPDCHLQPLLAAP